MNDAVIAVASTNAIIAASCANEAFKIATSSAPYLDNYMCALPSDIEDV